MTWSLFIDALLNVFSLLDRRYANIVFPNDFITLNGIDAQFKCASSNITLGISLVSIFIFHLASSISYSISFSFLCYVVFIAFSSNIFSILARQFFSISLISRCRNDSNSYSICMRIWVRRLDLSFFYVAILLFRQEIYFFVLLFSYSVNVILHIAFSQSFFPFHTLIEHWNICICVQQMRWIQSGSEMQNRNENNVME